MELWELGESADVVDEVLGQIQPFQFGEPRQLGDIPEFVVLQVYPLQSVVALELYLVDLIIAQNQDLQPRQGNIHQSLDLVVGEIQLAQKGQNLCVVQRSDVLYPIIREIQGYEILEVQEIIKLA